MKKLLTLIILALATATVATTVQPVEAVYAVTPPDSCFAFDETTGTILDYGNEITDSINPNGPWSRSIGTCPVELDIPAAISGTSVTAIGNDAFSGKQLTTVTTPNSIVSIGAGAFMTNNISSLKLNEGLVTIGDSAFILNQLRSVILPSTVTSPLSTTYGIGTCQAGPAASLGVFSAQGDGYRQLSDTIPMRGYLCAIHDWLTNPDMVAELSAMTEQAYYTAIYTADPSNPQGYTDFSEIGTFQDWSTGEGQVTGHFLMGGHLINPSQATLEYVNSQNNAVRQSLALTGALNGAHLTNYSSSSLADTFPYPADAGNPTLEEQTMMNSYLRNTYYRLGDTVDITAPTIAGYLTPPRVTLTLGQPVNSHTFTYQPQVTQIDFTNPSPVATVPSGLESIIAGSVMSLDEAKECNNIQSAELLPGNSFTAPNNDTTPQKTLGGLNFTLTCATDGGTATVSLKLNGLVDDLNKVRVYKQHATTKQVTDITKQVTLTKTPDNKLNLAYTLTDGQTLDDDGQANSEIVDPVYVTVNQDAQVLASTGTNIPLLAGIAGLLVVGGVVALVVMKRRRK